MPALIKDGDPVRVRSRRSYRFGGPPGRVVEVVRAGRFRRGPDGSKVCVGGDPACEGASFAWVLYPDGIRTPHPLADLEHAR